MAAKERHGVVVVRVSTSIIHRPDSGINHGESALRSDDWELFPNIESAIEAKYSPCQSCLYNYRPQSG